MSLEKPNRKRCLDMLQISMRILIQQINGNFPNCDDSMIKYFRHLPQLFFHQILKRKFIALDTFFKLCINALLPTRCLSIWRAIKNITHPQLNQEDQFSYFAQITHKPKRVGSGCYKYLIETNSGQKKRVTSRTFNLKFAYRNKIKKIWRL